MAAWRARRRRRDQGAGATEGGPVPRTGACGGGRHAEGGSGGRPLPRAAPAPRAAPRGGPTMDFLLVPRRSRRGHLCAVEVRERGVGEFFQAEAAWLLRGYDRRLGMWSPSLVSRGPRVQYDVGAVLVPCFAAAACYFSPLVCLAACVYCMCLLARQRRFRDGALFLGAGGAARRGDTCEVWCGVLAASWVGNGSDGGGRRRASSSCRCFRARLRNGRRVCPLRVFLKAKGQGFVHVAL